MAEIMTDEALPLDWPARLEAAVVEEAFLAGSGPGGQNANKVATNVQLRVNVFALGLPVYAWRKLKELAGSRMTQDGELLIVAREHRTREANRQAARERALELIKAAYIRQARRVPTKVSRNAKAKRVDAKKQRSSVKSGRGRVKLD